jgi:flagellin-like protein
MKNYYRKIKKNSKALSPVVASIILIAVTVAVSVVVAAWMSGMTVGLMGNSEQATITNVDLSTTVADNKITVTVQNTGTAPVTITAAYVNGAGVSSGIIVPTFGDKDATIAKGATQSFVITMPPATTFTSGEQVTVKMTTSKANNLVLTATVP